MRSFAGRVIFLMEMMCFDEKAASVPTGADHPRPLGHQLYYLCFGNAGPR